MPSIVHALNLSNLCKSKFTTQRRKCRGPGSGKGKFGGRGQNGQKAKRVMTLSQQTSIWRLSSQKVNVGSHKKNYNRTFVVTASMQETSPLPKNPTFASLLEYYDLPFYTRHIKIIGNGNTQNFYIVPQKQFIVTQKMNKRKTLPEKLTFKILSDIYQVPACTEIIKLVGLNNKKQIFKK